MRTDRVIVIKKPACAEGAWPRVAVLARAAWGLFVVLRFAPMAERWRVGLPDARGLEPLIGEQRGARIRENGKVRGVREGVEE